MNKKLLMDDYRGFKCLAGTGNDKSFDHELYDTYRNDYEQCYALSEEFFNFLRSFWGVDHIIKKLKYEGSYFAE